MGIFQSFQICIIKGTLMCVIMDVILWRAGLAKIHSGVPGYVLERNIHYTKIETGTGTGGREKNG